ncbi:MAG TPA: hypothetical protein VFI15_00745 [Candidatus Limnocylindrales bacterium]|nr:hypothetical protein [Candidatus Limnocylindrales bacterium]
MDATMTRLSETTEHGAIDGDASTYLEEMLVGELPAPARLAPATDQSIEVELVGPHLRLAGTVELGRFRRLSDFLNSHDGLIELRDCTVLRRNGEATKVTAQSIWVSPVEVTLIGEPAPLPIPVMPEFRINKRSEPLIVVTPGHTLSGNVFIPQDGTLGAFVESNDPRFIPMSDMRTRSLADRRIITRYPFAMLNRRHIVATTPLPPNMAPGRRVL